MLLDPEALGDDALEPELLGDALPELIDELPLAPCDDCDAPLAAPWSDCDEAPLGLDCDDDALEPLEPLFNAVSVCWSSWPVCSMFCCCWNCLSALSVCGPILPSTFPW